MKKIYIFLVLISTIFSAFCMNEQKTYNENSLDNYTNEFELQPIYKTKSDLIEEQKPLLKTITPNPPSPKLMQILFDSVKTIRGRDYGGCYNPTETNLVKLIPFIISMQKARYYDIDEECMIQFSYNKFKQDPCWAKELFTFCYLKKYMQTIITTQEALPDPFVYEDVWGWDKLPAFVRLKRGLYSIEPNTVKVIRENKTFINYIFNPHKKTHNKYLSWSYDELKNEFRNYALCFVDHDLSLKDMIDESDHKDNYRLYELLKIIEAGKALTLQKKEKDFADDIIAQEQSITDWLNIRTLISSDTYKNIQKRIYLLCLLIHKYNKEREAKITPRKKQFRIYKQMPPFNIGFPDQFDKTLFHKKVYAFDEFQNFIDSTKILLYRGAKHIQKHINELSFTENK